MAPPPVLAKSLTSEVRLIGIDRLSFDLRPSQEVIESADTRISMSGLHHDSSFDKGNDRHPARLGVVDGSVEPPPFRFVSENRQYGRRINHHQSGNPQSS